MELLQMKYFLAVAREESVSKAAESLYITQPSLSRQIQSMEREVGQPLFVRGGRKMTLTEAGTLLKKRAEEIVALYEKTESEWSDPDASIGGEVSIGGGETYGMRFLFDAVAEMRRRYPNVKVSVFSGDIADVCERLDKGLVDFGLLIEPFDVQRYEKLRLPYADTWGLLMPKDHPLAEKERVTPEDLKGIPIIQSRHSLPRSIVTEWYRPAGDVEVVATYNLLYNASLMAKAGIGCVLSIDKIVDVSGDCGLAFRPLFPPLRSRVAVVWKKYQAFSRAAQTFLKIFRERVEAAR